MSLCVWKDKCILYLTSLKRRSRVQCVSSTALEKAQQEKRRLHMGESPSRLSISMDINLRQDMTRRTPHQSIPKGRLISIEHPFKIQDYFKAIQSLGGPKGIHKVR